MMKRVMILAAIAFVFSGAFATGLENAAATRSTLSENGSPKIELTAEKKAEKKTKKSVKKGVKKTAKKTGEKTGEKIKKVVNKTVTKTVNKTTEKVKKIFN